MKFVEKKREFTFTRHDFKQLCQMVNDHTGIQLGASKQDMLYGRLSRRLREHKLTSFAEYIELLMQDEDSDEFGNFINAVTTNLTSFFREAHHFDYMKHTILPQLMHHNRNSRRIRIWSAGCSTGEEPYTIAMTVADTVPPGWDVKILATDIDTEVLEHAQQGEYALSRVKELGDPLLKRWFLRQPGSEQVRVKDQLKAMIYFRRLNLLEQWPMKGPLDIIFCRNVIIYFDMSTKQRLMQAYANLLAPTGYLLLGHSEAMNEMSDRFKLTSQSVYMLEQ